MMSSTRSPLVYDFGPNSSPVPEFHDDLGQDVDDEEDDDEPPPVLTGSNCQRMLESLRYYMMCSSGFPQESFKH